MDTTITIPAEVFGKHIKTFKRNYIKATAGTGRLMLFAGDQKVEHMNADFFGENIAFDDANPIHLFQIAASSKIGVFATQLGLIARYGNQFPDIPYLIKLNSKTNLVPIGQDDPLSKAWYTVKQVVDFSKKSGLNILGVGYTIYLGSIYEAEMLTEAAQIIHEAHAHGLLTVLWMYPKGTAIKDEHDVNLIAGAAGVAACLGADFVKLKIPMLNNTPTAELLKKVVSAAGNTGVLCEGGAKEDPKLFLTELYNQLHIGGTRGNGTGRNIHQCDLNEAIKMANAVHAITVQYKTVEEALDFLNE